MPGKESKKVNGLAVDSQYGFSGYEFHKDTIANQLAYVFGGEEGEKKAKDIMDKANQLFPQPIQMPERKKYIEEEIKKTAQALDNDFHKGLSDIFDSLKDSKEPLKGEQAGKDIALGLMSKLGLNVDKDNVQTHYDPGPPQVFQISWVNRPTQNLNNENSNVNQLAKLYTNQCPLEEQKSFNQAWTQHKNNAKAGGPKLDPQEFLDQADKSFAETVKSAKNPEQANLNTSREESQEQQATEQPKL